MPGDGARNLPRVALDVLSDIELAEAQLLCWGMVDGSFTEDELIDLAQKRLLNALDGPDKPPYGSATEVLDVLKHHGLLFELPIHDSKRFRSRTAEAVRLFFRLKQLLPRHDREGGWRGAPDLVADYRLILRPREYPRRHIQPQTVEKRLTRTGEWNPLASEVLRAILAADTDKPLELADFQIEAAERILGELAGPSRRAGTIVCAGTGSGKTLAFYLPVFLLLARLAGPERWTRCLAFYPRNELLRDQLTSALQQVRILNRVLATAGRSPVTVGALFGEVPSRPDDEGALRRNWTRTDTGATGGWACPYLRCPEPGCEHSNLVWLDSDRSAGIERLCCAKPGCDYVLDGTDFVLTRKSMISGPPDLLFTGLEMVNQSMSSIQTRRLLGIGVDHPERRPRLVLLDEAHTYSGTYGAQAALLLRRWKQASGATPHFVGLSATLEDARRFFATLVGEPESRLEEISPRSADLESEGQEILLALRGDPVSKTSLLSTSIQSAMLLRRVLDPMGTEDSLFGTKVFAFTDDLDVTNRLFHNLLDAEGWEVTRSGVRARQAAPLAGLRRRVAPEHHARFRAGQSWDLVEELGHELSDRPVVRVGRTSSQDAGVDRDAQTIVATASLELGFDDPEVGAVLQHKAPRDAASFVQRQGRAGRPRGTRPWTVAVLSDYGRDRLAYQGYEQLFSPQLRPRHLPIRNRHVLRIQAVFALMDWLAAELKARHGDPYARLWMMLAQPPSANRYQQHNEQRLDRTVQLVEELLNGGVRERQFARYLEQALAVGPEIVEQLLWTPPRSLMLSVLPTVVRRLRRRWEVAIPPGTTDWPSHEYHAFWSPLPEFVPKALFSDLNLPEVAVSLPPYRSDDVEYMPILQAMREFPPGRVSRRFGISRQDICHWIQIPASDTEDCLVGDFCRPEDSDELGVFRAEVGDGIEEIPCVRPRHFVVEVPPRDVGTTSNARLLWATQLLPRIKPVSAEMPAGSPWQAIVRSVGFFAHGYGNAIEVRRFALGSNYEVRRNNGQNESGNVRFARETPVDTERIALGYAIDADAMRVELEVPPDLHRQVAKQAELLRSIRTARFAYEIQTDPELDGIANSFMRGWLVQICLSSLLMEAVERETSLERAAESVFEERAHIPLEEVLDVIFQSITDEEGEGTADDRRTELRALFRDALVQGVLRRAAPVLWAEPDRSWESWLHERFLSTLGAAVLDACSQLCPEVDAGDLCLDINAGPRGEEEGCTQPEHEEIWLSETSPGGSGVVEAVSAAYASDPLRFFHLIEAALGPSDFEEVDIELGTLVGWLAGDTNMSRPEIIEAIQAVRSAYTHRDTIEANEALRSHLEFAGLAVTHPVLVAMQARILRPGSSPETDRLLFEMVSRWRVLEERLGVEVDARIVAYTMSADDQLDRALAGVGSAPVGTDRQPWRYGTLYGLLWPRGLEIRSQMLSAYNPFSDLPQTDRWLVLAVLPLATTEIRIESAEWYRQLCVTLVNEGAVVLSAPPDRRRELRLGIMQTLAEPLDTETLLVQPALTAVSQEGRRMRARFEVREGLQ